MTKIIWTHHAKGSYGYKMSDVSYIDEKGRYVFEDTTEDPYDYTRDDKLVRTVISEKSVITTITNIASGEIVERHIDKVKSITFE